MSKPITMVQFPRDLPNEYYAAIGEIAARWSWLEHQLHVIIRVILRLDKKQGRIVIVGMGVKPMASMIRGLALRWVSDARLKNDLRAFAKATLEFKPNRDDFIHGVYCYPEGKPDTICLYQMRSAEERIMPGMARLPIKTLQNAAYHLCQLQDVAQELTHRLKASPPMRA